MEQKKNAIPPGMVLCPKCGAHVDDVDGEYRRHYVVANLICRNSKREIDYEKQPPIE